MRGADVPGICSVRVQDLFPDIPDPIHQAGEDISPVRAAARDALASAREALQPQLQRLNQARADLDGARELLDAANRARRP